ncbi:uncharacterized protein LTHEOB_9613 [Lasiodiplodia theobromae]|uniref:uncharacterized protein n=1 Tax=Lasiodiplodia theobromae TaxID=45133 RepID=UPI0015C3C1B2|nr:uncharacterized protein LTHEOB_9613 [Lasiodiplodia theobromae]KAF4540139.1 hypothetical protein LTHEOB_9613 [Lasiodiplodia theobromae]
MSSTNAPPPPETFTITAPPNSDIWASPPSTHRFNAPLAHVSRAPLQAFTRAGLTLSLPPQESLIQYDQGGILLAITRPGEQQPSDAKRWLKTGIEMCDGEPWLTAVGCDRWSDLSMVPLAWGGSVDEGKGRGPTARVEVERVKDALWVYWVTEGKDGENGRRVPIRELSWFFSHEEIAGEAWEVSVSAYAVRPLKNEKDEDEALNVEFRRFEVEWS